MKKEITLNLCDFCPVDGISTVTNLECCVCHKSFCKKCIDSNRHPYQYATYGNNIKHYICHQCIQTVDTIKRNNKTISIFDNNKLVPDTHKNSIDYGVKNVWTKVREIFQSQADDLIQEILKESFISFLKRGEASEVNKDMIIQKLQQTINQVKQGHVTDVNIKVEVKEDLPF